MPAVASLLCAIDVLRVVGSIRAGITTASAITRQLASHPRQDGIASALRELGRLERPLFTLDWIEAPDLRRTTSHEHLREAPDANPLARTSVCMTPYTAWNIIWAKREKVPVPP